MQIEQRVLGSESFLNAHPDMKYRNKGWAAFEEGRPADAIGHFMRAARYGDKASQAMLAELHWLGNGVPQDRATAYAWADLAAERGYPPLLVIRERYWNQLDPETRRRAIAIGQALYREFGDDVAKPRMERHLRQARRQMAGGRIHRGADIHLRDASGQWVKIPGHYFYAANFWEPNRYQQWVDETWLPPREGKVDVGDLVPIKPDPHRK